MEKAGEPIPGSRFLRAFCSVCGEPMRVSSDACRGGAALCCVACSPPRPPNFGCVTSVRAIRQEQEEDAIADMPREEGEWDNAVRMLEDAS